MQTGSVFLTPVSRIRVANGNTSRTAVQAGSVFLTPDSRTGVADGNNSRTAVTAGSVFVIRQTCRYCISLRSWPSSDSRVSGLGTPSGTPPRPGFPRFRSWLPLRHATQARISAFPVLVSRSGPGHRACHVEMSAMQLPLLRFAERSSAFRCILPEYSVLLQHGFV